MGLCQSSKPEGLFVYCHESFDVYWNGKTYKFGYEGHHPIGYEKVKERIIFHPGREVHVLEIKRCTNTYYKLRFSPTWANIQGTVWIPKSEYKTYWKEYIRKTNKGREW